MRHNLSLSSNAWLKFSSSSVWPLIARLSFNKKRNDVIFFHSTLVEWLVGLQIVSYLDLSRPSGNNYTVGSEYQIRLRVKMKSWHLFSGSSSCRTISLRPLYELRTLHAFKLAQRLLPVLKPLEVKAKSAYLLKPKISCSLAFLRLWQKALLSVVLGTIRKALFWRVVLDHNALIQVNPWSCTTIKLQTFPPFRVAPNRSTLTVKTEQRKHWWITHRGKRKL